MKDKMNDEQALEILWQHFSWEFTEFYDDCDLDEEYEKDCTKRDWVIDQISNAGGLFEYWDGKSTDSVEYAAGIYHNLI